MIQDDLVNNLRSAQSQAKLNFQDSKTRRTKTKYTVILEDGKDSVIDIESFEVHVIGDKILDNNSGKTGKIVRVNS